MIHPINRGQIIDDAMALLRSGHLKVKILLEILKYLQYEVDYIPWLAATTNNLEYLKRVLNDYSHLDALYKVRTNVMVKGLYCCYFKF